MRIDLRDQQRRRIGTVEVDADQRPTRVEVAETGREVFLNWEGAVDDSGQLRRCVVCGCRDLFRARSFPQITGIVVVLAFAGAAVGALGLATPPMIVAMIVVLVLDVAILVLSRTRLRCYACHTAYQRLPIARYHRPWDRAVAERYTAAEPGTDDSTPPLSRWRRILSINRRKADRRARQRMETDRAATEQE